MKKQTAVEFLVDELNQKIDFIPMDKWDKIRDIVQQAKEMEKEQIIDARNSALRDKYKSVMNDLITYGQAKIDVKTSEEYFNETYKQD